MSTIYDQVKKFAEQIQEGLDKVIYVKDKVYLIDKEKLPNKYYQKNNILFVDDRVKYLREINNREPNEEELDQFELIERKYGEIIPPELIREHLLSLSIEDIVKLRRTSKEWKKVIDNLWCDLIKRDYPGEKYNEDCYNKYKKLYTRITDKRIKKVADKYNVSEDDVAHLLIESKFDPSENDTFVLDFKQILNLITGMIDFKNCGIVLSGNSNTIKYLIKRSDYKEYLTNLFSAINELAPYIKDFPNINDESFKGVSIPKYIKISDKVFIGLYEEEYGKGSFERDLILELNKQGITDQNKIDKKLKKYYSIINSC